LLGNQKTSSIKEEIQRAQTKGVLSPFISRNILRIGVLNLQVFRFLIMGAKYFTLENVPYKIKEK